MNRWILFAGLGMIRFGMEMFEESLKKLGGPKLSVILQKYTDTGWKASGIGTIVTAILNSSTLVSLLTLGFVSAGMMKLVNAIGVLVGANIGSTATGLIVGYLGFGEFKISMFALPLIAIGGIIMIVTGKKYRGYWSRLLVGFGLFFLGIDFLKENVEVMAQMFNLEQYAGMSLWIFGLIGIIITAMIQSSGAMGVMTLAALSSEIITFEAGFAILLGAAVGTTFTALIASLSGSTAKKQLAVANLIFNALTVVLGIIFFHQFIWITLDLLGFRDNPVMGNAMINTVFSTLTSLVFVPILQPFTRFINRLIPEKEEIYPLQIIQTPLQVNEKRYNEDMASISLNALQYDKKYLTGQILEYISDIRGIDTNLIKNNESNDTIIENLKKFDNEEHRELYNDIIEQLDTIFTYSNQLSHTDLEHDDRQELLALQRQFISLSNACKATENIREHITMIKNTIDPNLGMIYKEILSYIINLNQISYAIMNNKDTTTLESLQDLVHDIVEYRNNILTRVSPYLSKGNIGEMDVSSLVNMTREIADGYKDIARAIEEK